MICLILRIYTTSYIYTFWYNFDTVLYQFLETETSNRTLTGLNQLLRFSGFSLYPLSFFIDTPFKLVFYFTFFEEHWISLSPTVSYCFLLFPTVSYCFLLFPTVSYCFLLFPIVSMFLNIAAYQFTLSVKSG